MTYKSIIQILLVLAIISTICISIMKPKMHKPVMVLNSQFSVEHDDGINIDEQNIAVMVQDAELNDNSGIKVQNEGGINFVEPKIEDVTPVNFKNTQTTAQNTGNAGNVKTLPINNTGIKNNNTKIKTTSTKTVNSTVKPAQTKVSTAPVANKPSTTNSQSPKIDLNKIVNNNQKIINTPAQTQTTPVTSAPVTSAKPAPVQTVIQTKPQGVKPQVRLESQTTSNPSKPITAKTETKPVVMTAQEEEIAWNKWRSNLNNQIMKDSKLPTMPNGIIFKYKFTVDKYGKVSNVQTSSTTPGYTPYAIQFIAPVIRSYQGRAILNFPTGSNRVTTEVSGAWKISSSSKLSTPDDYHDIEKIKR